MRDRSCMCGSGKEKFPTYDARGIFCFYSCDNCDAKKRKTYRPEIFTDPNYWAPDLGDDE